MADLEKTVSILFKGVDQVSGTMDTIGSRFTSFGSTLESATAPLAGIALAVEKIEAGLVIMAASGMIAATTAAGKFQSGMNEIHTLLKESPQDIAAFDTAIESYATNSTQSLEDIQAAIYQSLSANVDYKDSIAFITEAEKLAVAGKATLKESVDLLTSTMTAYGASWDQANQYSDVFFKTVEIGKVTVPELSSALALVAPIASGAGVSIEEMSAAIAALTAGGLKAGPSAEYLRQAIQGIIDPSKESKAVMESLGISYGASAIEANGFSGVMKDVYEKTNGNVDVLTKVFGNVQALTVAMTLGKDSSGYYAKALDEVANAAGSTQRAYEIMVGNFEKINTRLVNSMKLALIESGKPLLDDWAKIAAGLAEVFKGLKVELQADAFSEIYDEIDKFSSEFAIYLQDIAKALPEAMEEVDFDGFLKSIEDLGSSVGDLFKSLFGDFDLTKPDDLAAAIQKVVDAGTKLTEFSAGIADGLAPFAKSMGEWIDKALAADTETTKLAGSTAGLGQGVNTMVFALNLVAPAMAIFSGAIVVDAVATLSKLAIALASLPGAPVVAVGAAMTGLAYAVNSLNPPIELATAKFDAFGNLIGDFDNMSDKASTSIKDIGEGLQNIPPVTDIRIDTEIDSDAYDIENFSKIMRGLPLLTIMKVEAKINNEEEINQYMSEIWNAEPIISVKSQIDEASARDVKYGIEKIVNPDGTVTYINVEMKPGATSKINDALKEIPTEKMLEIKLQGEIDKELETIKANAATVQAAMEWSAKIDIATAEADASRMKSAFESVSSTIDSVTKGLNDILGQDWGKMDLSQYMSAIDAASQQLKIQKESWEIQKKLIQSQIDYNNAKTEKLKYKDTSIKIDSTGLEPALETIMWQIIQKVQIKANEEAASFLLGMPG